MSRRANVVRHGANHLCGGSDEIPGICNLLDPTLVDPQWTPTETLLLDSRDSDGASMTTVLESGRVYRVVIRGTYSVYDVPLTTGTPEADAMFPSITSRATTEVGRDAETEWANPIGAPVPTHKDGGGGGGLKINLGSGLIHIEPEGGPFTVAEPGHLYEYMLTGEGSAPAFKIIDGDYTDNYGQLKIVLYISGGPGAVPNPAMETDGSWLQVSGGALVYVANPPVTSIAADGDTPMYGDIVVASGDGIDVTQDDAGTVTVSATASGGSTGDGWLDDTAETWTYASGSGGGAATFTVSGDLRTKYTVGTRLKLTQSGTVKHFVCTGSSHAGGTTTVSIMAGSDYTLANSSITANYHSYAANPQGWPGWFNFAASPTGFSSLTTSSAVFAVIDRVCFYECRFLGTSNATTFNWTLPIAIAGQLASFFGPISLSTDNSATIQTSRVIATTTTNIRLDKANAADGWTNSGTKAWSATGCYRIG